MPSEDYKRLQRIAEYAASMLRHRKHEVELRFEEGELACMIVCDGEELEGRIELAEKNPGYFRIPEDVCSVYEDIHPGIIPFDLFVHGISGYSTDFKNNSVLVNDVGKKPEKKEAAE